MRRVIERVRLLQGWGLVSSVSPGLNAVLGLSSSKGGWVSGLLPDHRIRPGGRRLSGSGASFGVAPYGGPPISATQHIEPGGSCGSASCLGGGSARSPPGLEGKDLDRVLNPAYEGRVTFAAGGEATTFGTIAGEHFSFHSAQEYLEGEGEVEAGMPARLTAVESAIGELKAGIQALVGSEWRPRPGKGGGGGGEASRCEIEGCCPTPRPRMLLSQG